MGQAGVGEAELHAPFMALCLNAPGGEIDTFLCIMTVNSLWCATLRRYTNPRTEAQSLTMKKLLAALIASLFAVGAFAADAAPTADAAPAAAAAAPAKKVHKKHHHTKKAAAKAEAAAPAASK